MVCKECIFYGWVTFGSVIAATVLFYLYAYYAFSRTVSLKHSYDLKKAEQSEIKKAVEKAYATLSDPNKEYMRRKAAFKL